MSVEAISEMSRKNEFFDGARRSVPVIVASAPFGILFGALAIDNGFTVFEAFLMSATVYAGASQMVGLNLFGEKIAPWVIVLSIFAVNFRHVLYSAAVGRHIRHWPFLQKAVAFFFLVDPQYAESERRAMKGEPIGFAWYLGMGIPIYIFWNVSTVIGALFGRLVPNFEALGIDFLLTIYFLGLVMEFRDRSLFLPVVAASAVASVLAYDTIGSPWHVSVGALAGIVVAVLAPVRNGGKEHAR